MLMMYDMHFSDQMVTNKVVKIFNLEIITIQVAVQSFSF